MTALLASSTATSATATEGDVKTYLANLRDFMADLLGTDSANKAVVQGLLGNVLNGKLTKTGAYTVVAADRGKVIDCSGTWTMNISAAATLGDGFTFAVWNSGSGTITIDPNLSESIDGGLTKAIGPGKFAIVYCGGSSFGTIGIGFALSDLLAVDGAGSGLDADLLDGNHASAFSLAGHTHAYVPTDSGVGAVGSMALIWRTAGTQGATSGATFSGTSYAMGSSIGPAPSGTWRNISGVTMDANSGPYICQRIL
jgi:hypothetical protein